MPKRIQRKRTKGWRIPENTICVSRPSRWGNIYRVGSWVRDDPTRLPFEIKTAEQAVALFREWVTPHANIIREFLHGKNLACWCPLDQPCHADVLLELANGEQSDDDKV